MYIYIYTCIHIYIYIYIYCYVLLGPARQAGTRAQANPAGPFVKRLSALAVRHCFLLADADVDVQALVCFNLLWKRALVVDADVDAEALACFNIDRARELSHNC